MDSQRRDNAADDINRGSGPSTGANQVVTRLADAFVDLVMKVASPSTNTASSYGFKHAGLTFAADSTDGQIIELGRMASLGTPGMPHRAHISLALHRLRRADVGAARRRASLGKSPAPSCTTRMPVMVVAGLLRSAAARMVLPAEAWHDLPSQCHGMQAPAFRVAPSPL